MPTAPRTRSAARAVLTGAAVAGAAAAVAAVTGCGPSPQQPGVVAPRHGAAVAPVDPGSVRVLRAIPAPTPTCPTAAYRGEASALTDPVTRFVLCPDTANGDPVTVTSTHPVYPLLLDAVSRLDSRYAPDPCPAPRPSPVVLAVTPDGRTRQVVLPVNGCHAPTGPVVTVLAAARR